MRLLGAVHWLQLSSSRQPTTPPATWKRWNVPLGASFAENISADDPGADYTYSYEDVEDDAPPPTTIARVWTPDCIIKQVTGPFAAYSKFKGLEHQQKMRAHLLARLLP